MGVRVSRQRYYDTNELVIELACGSKYAGKDILPIKFPGEGKNLVSPIDAVRIALDVAKKWHAQYFDEPKQIALVNADDKGTRVYFNPNSKQDIVRLEAWAVKAFATMDKCGHCQKPMSKAEPFTIDAIPNREFCSERCLATKYHDMFGVEAPKMAPKNKKPKSIFGIKP